VNSHGILDGWHGGREGWNIGPVPSLSPVLAETHKSGEVFRSSSGRAGQGLCDAVQRSQAISADLQAAWRAAADGLLQTPHWEPPAGIQDSPEQFVILIACRDEKHQVELLGRFQKEGLPCKALLS
jgi:hypothetical protein